MEGRPASPREMVRRRLASVVEVVGAIALIVMTVHVVANGASRSFAGAPIEHTLEYVQYWYLPAIAMLGFVSAQLRGRHITADLLYQAFPGLVKRGVALGSNLVCAVVMCAFTWGTGQAALRSFEIRQTAGVTDVPTWPVHFLLPLTFGLLAVAFGLEAYRMIRSNPADYSSPEADGPEELADAETAAHDDKLRGTAL